MRGRRSWIALMLALSLWCIAVPVWAQGAGNTFVGQNIHLQAGETIEGSVTIMGGRALFDRGSTVNGDVAIMGGEVTVYGAINGDLVAFGGTVDLGDTAVIDGDVVAVGVVRRHPEAQINGHLIQGLAAQSVEKLRLWPNASQATAQPIAWRLPGLMAIARGLTGLLAMLMVALAAALILPDNLANINRVMFTSAPLSVGVGILTLTLVAVLIPLLVVICIGIPVAVALALIVAVCILVGWVAAGKALGAKLLALLGISEVSALVEALAGVALLTLAAYVPCVGWLLALTALCWGLGAVVLTRVGTTGDSFWQPFRGPSGAPTTPADASTGEHADGDTRPLGDGPQ